MKRMLHVQQLQDELLRDDADNSTQVEERVTQNSVRAPIRKASSMGRDGSIAGTSQTAFWGSHFIAGQVAGMCGYPFAYPGDFIKCRVQFMTPAEAAKVRVIPEMKKVIRTEGLRGLYRGLWSPFFLFGITSSAYFE